MGYTHYWKQTKAFTREEWAEVKEDIAAILKHTQHEVGIPLGDWEGAPRTQPVISDDRISFNGVGEDGHETFYISRKRELPYEGAGKDRIGNAFCKTARKPYDIAVTAILCYLSSVRETYRVSSDGHGHNFLAGLELARKALPRYANVLDIPMGVMESDRWVGPYTHHFTDAYSFRFCVDGKAYISRHRTGETYCFPTHREAAEFGVKHNHILNATGWFDERRRNSLKRQQEALFRRMIKAAPLFGRASDKPPAYVRPDQMPPNLPRAYYFKDVLALAEAA